MAGCAGASSCADLFQSTLLRPDHQDGPDKRNPCLWTNGSVTALKNGIISRGTVVVRMVIWCWVADGVCACMWQGVSVPVGTEKDKRVGRGLHKTFPCPRSDQLCMHHI